MTRRDVANGMAEKSSLTAEQCDEAILAFMDVVSGSLKGGNDVFLRGFGTFKVVTQNQKIARDIGRGKPIVVPEKKVAKFKPSAEIVIV